MRVFDNATIKEDFGKAASGYERHAHLQRVVREHAIALAQRYWPQNDHLLDLGSGTGAFTHEAALLKQRWRITGVDLAPGMCKRAAARGLVANADAAQLPFADRCFDGVFSSLMLQWCDTPLRVFSEMARVIRPGGTCVVSTLVSGTLHELADAFKALDDKPHVSAFMQAHDVLAQAQAAGLTLDLAKQAAHVEHHADTIALMRSLQAIGATNKHTHRPRGLMTPGQFTRLEQAYAKRYADAQGLPVTWQVLYLALRKAT